MSIWGPLPSENDDAADWLADFLEAPDLIQLNEAFDEVLNLKRDDYLEITEGANAVVATAIVAELFGAPDTERLLSPVQLNQLQQLATNLALGARVGLVKRAVLALQKVVDGVDNSELFQLMHESPDLGELWRNAIDSLNTRLLRLRATE